jgi:hypothetical protein
MKIKYLAIILFLSSCDFTPDTQYEFIIDQKGKKPDKIEVNLCDLNLVAKEISNSQFSANSTKRCEGIAEFRTYYGEKTYVCPFGYVTTGFSKIGFRSSVNDGLCGKPEMTVVD